LAEPLRWKTPRRVFVNSMSDLFHDLVPDDFLDDCFMVMARASQHVFQVLTKRPERMRDFMRHAFYKMGPPPNVWLGVSVEDQRRADERIPVLVQTPAAVRFISAEPLLGPVDLAQWIRPPTIATVSFSTTPFRPVGQALTIRYDLLQWVIVGGESGPHHRPMAVEWAESIAAQCGDVALYVKQDSGSRPGKQGRLSDALWARKEYPGNAVGSGASSTTHTELQT
jgi:protein gp37